MKAAHTWRRSPPAWLAVCVLGWFLVSAGPVRAQDSLDTQAVAESVWREFRRGHGFHSQLIGISAPDATGHRVLLIAEPSERWSERSLKALLAADAVAVHTRRHRLMHGGEVVDALAVLRPGLTPGQLQALNERVHLAMHGSARSARLVALPADAPIVLGPALDLAVSASDLHRYLVAGGMVFESGVLQAATAVQLLAAQARGVYHSRGDAGLVLWALPRGGDISALADQVRHFALESDLILGAMADKRTVLVVARRRQEPLRRLPPLRNDTVLLLAAIGARQISQSYERNMWMAGRVGEEFDRAPIHLSDELRHTEYGSLLNIVDQLLKGWSEHGHVAYRDFDYPTPGNYPFGANRASDSGSIGGLGFLFNWNTDGVFYVNRHDGFEIAAVHRTGALPVIYGSMEARRVAAEATGYDYFAGSGDANIARVVQYATMYALFRRYDIRSDWLSTAARQNSSRPVLLKASSAMLDLVLEQREDAASWAALRARVAQSSAPDLADMFARYEAAVDRLRASGPERREEAKAQLAGLLGDPRGAGLEVAKRRAAIDRNPAATPAERETARGLRLAAEDASAIALWLNKSGTGAYVADRFGLWTALEQANEASQRGWIKTAAIVASRDNANRRAVGGHNIDSAMTQLRADAAVPVGTVRVGRDAEGQLVVLYNAADRGRVGVLSRRIAQFEGNTTVAQAETQLSSALSSAVHAERSLAQAVGRTGPPAADYRALAGAGERRVRGAGGLNTVGAGLATAHRPTVVVRRLADRFEVVSTESPDMLQLDSMAALHQVLVDHARGGAFVSGQARIVMEGFPADKIQALMHSVRKRIERGGSAANDGLFIAHPTGGAEGASAFAGFKPHWSQVRVQQAEATWRPITEGRWTGHTEVTLRMNLAEPAQPPLFVRLVFYVKKLLTDSAQRQALLAAVAEAFKGFGHDLSVAAMPGRFKAALQRAGFDANDVEIRAEAEDIFVAHASVLLVVRPA